MKNELTLRFGFYNYTKEAGIINNELKIKPSYVLKKGVDFEVGEFHKIRIPSKINAWVLEEKYSITTDYELQLKKFVEGLLPIKGKVQSLKRIMDGEIKVSVLITTYEVNTGFECPASIMKFLVDVGANLQFDIYNLSE